MELLINFIFFFLGGLLTFLFIKYKNKNNTNDINFRKGIITRSYTTSRSDEEFNVQVEVIEILTSNDKSKIKVIDIHADISKFNSNTFKDKIGSILDNTWIKSSDIEYIDDRSEERRKRIEKILN